MKVINMTSSRGNTVPNQFILIRASIFITDTTRHDCKIFQSYESAIAVIDKIGRVYLDKNKWDYSATTGKYRNQFLGETIAETRKKIESGEYKLVDLNK